MKRLFLVYLLSCVSFIGFTQEAKKPTAEIKPIAIGSLLPFPENELLDVSGKKINFNAAEKGNGLLVVFSCNTCPYVVKNESRLLNIIDMCGKLNIGVVVLNSNEAYRESEDSYEAMKAYASEKGMNCPYLIDTDSKMADAFGAKRTPETFLFDKTGHLAYHGAIDDNPGDASNVKRQHLLEAMKELSEGRAVSFSESKSVGCGIKRKS